VLIPTIGHRLPRALTRVLFGDRERFGLTPRRDDPCWKEWEQIYLRFYDTNQKASVGKVVNDAGYRVMRRVDLTGKRVLEVGPGDISHMAWWRGRPEHLALADIYPQMLERSAARLTEQGITCSSHRIDPTGGGRLPFDDASMDMVLSFYCLEHLHPLDRHVREMLRVLKPGGLIAGAIPAEGGLAWGAGRFLTTRRWLKKHSSIDPDKIICWEHPNFADHVLNELDNQCRRVYVRCWPLSVPSVDVNLIIKFVYAKAGSSLSAGLAHEGNARQ
jgi:SAM-dependent methyltransferase